MIQVLLTEALVEVSNGAKNYATQRELLAKLLAEPEAVWSKPEVAACFSTPEALLRLIGFGGPSPEITALRKKVLSLVYNSISHHLPPLQLYHLISLFHVIARRAVVPEPNVPDGGFVPCVDSGIAFPYRHPFSPHVPVLLPNFLLLLRTIHTLWEPTIMSQIPPEWQAIYAVDESYAASLLGEQPPASLGRVDTTPYAAHDETQTGYIRHARHFVENVRDVSYRFLQACCMPGDGFFTTPDLANVLKSTVFCYLDRMQNRHWRAMLQTFLPVFVRNCPVPLLPHLITPLLPAILTAAFTRFSAEWTALNERVAQPRGRERAEAIEEIMLRDATREYFDFLRICFHVDGAPEDEHMKAQAAATADTISVFLISDQVCWVSFFSSSSSLILFYH